MSTTRFGVSDFDNQPIVLPGNISIKSNVADVVKMLKSKNFNKDSGSYSDTYYLAKDGVNVCVNIENNKISYFTLEYDKNMY